MKKPFASLLLALLLFITVSVTAQAVKVTGEVLTALNIDKAEFEKFKQVSVIYKDKTGKDHSYSGVALGDILQKAGVTLGAALRGQNITKYVMAEATDGYKVVFSLVELDKEFTDKQIILANKVDGNALPATEGPYRIIAPDEKKAARSIRQVTSIKVAFAK